MIERMMITDEKNQVIQRTVPCMMFFILFVVICIVFLLVCSVYSGYDMANNGIVYKTEFSSHDIMTINKCFQINLDNNTNIVKGRYYVARDPGVLFWIKGIDNEKVILQQCGVSSNKINNESVLSMEETIVVDSWKYKISDTDEIFFYIDSNNSLIAVLHKKGFNKNLYDIFD